MKFRYVCSFTHLICYFSEVQHVRTLSLSACTSGAVGLWGTETLVEVSTLDVQGAVAAFWPAGKRLVIGHEHVHVRDVETGGSICLFYQHSAGISCVAFSSDGKYVASGSSDMTIWVLNAETGAIISGPLVGHGSKVHSVAFSPNGKRIVSGEKNSFILVWDAATGAMVSKSRRIHNGVITCVAFSPNGKHCIRFSR